MSLVICIHCVYDKIKEQKAQNQHIDQIVIAMDEYKVLNKEGYDRWNNSLCGKRLNNFKATENWAEAERQSVMNNKNLVTQ